VIIDCSPVAFKDSAGYHATLDATRYAKERGRALVVRNPSPQCARTLNLCDGTGELTIEMRSVQQRAESASRAIAGGDDRDRRTTEQGDPR
jgi:anti-anti-sigma regulatory factor